MYLLLSNPWNYLQIDHIFGHKASFNHYKKTEITPCILSHHNVITKAAAENMKKNWRLNNTLLEGGTVSYSPSLVGAMFYLLLLGYYWN
jgi:hypothetical protein